MTLPASGNSISLSQVNTELNKSSTATINIDSTAVRELFNVPSGPILWSNGFGKSSIIQGALWAWGFGYEGRLGLGDSANRRFPVQIGTDTNWKQVSVGSTSAAIKTDGTLWTWGPGFYGALGLGDQVSRFTPVQVGTANNWKQIAVGAEYSLALKTDGTIWKTSGYPSYGVFTQVGSETGWKSINSGEFCMFAIR